MRNIDELLRESCKEKIEIPDKINYRITSTLNELDRPKHLKIYIRKICTLVASLVIILFGGISVYAALGGKIDGENVFEWIGIKVSNKQYNEYKEKVEEQIYLENNTDVTLDSTFYDGELAILEFNVKLSEKDKEYLNIGETVVTEEYINKKTEDNTIDVFIDGKQLTPEEVKAIEIEEHKDEKIDKIWLSINNKETVDKNGNTYIEAAHNNNRIIINDTEYYLRQNAQQNIKKINDYEYKVFQTYFIPQEEYKDNDILNFTIDSMDVLPDNNQLGESQKRIHISDNYKIQVKKNERIAQIDNISVTTSDKKMFQKVDYVATSPIQTTIKITTKLSNIDYNEIINTNNNNYISNINYEIYDENNNALSFYKIELSKKIIYSDGKKEELELDEPIASEDLKDAEIELTQYIICEKNTSALTINTVNDQNTVLNKLNIKLEE